MARRIRFWVTLAGLLLLLGAASAGVYRIRQEQAGVTLPMAPARGGEFEVIIRCRGQLKASRSVDIYVPIVPQPRVAWLAPDGGLVKQGDPIVKLDSSATEQQLQQMQAQLVAAQASLDQALAQARIDTEQDRSDFADSQFTVEKARLEASKQEIVSRIQGEESKIDLGVAEQKLKVEEATVDLHKASNSSKLASLTRQRDKAQADVNLMKARMAEMEIKAPLSGFIVFQPNYSQGWMNAKPFKVGDNVWPGGLLAEIPDLDTLQMDATVEEIDRGRIAIGQDVRVRVDALPELTMAGKLSQISLLAEQSNEFPPTRSFRAYAAIPKPDQHLRPGMNAGMDIIIDRIPHAISIPAKALFTRAGKPVVFLAQSNRYRQVEVKVLARNPDEIAISGIRAGAMVALADPEKKEKK
ncbi:MAG TPA: efflux RND transporter periplasmic adaptor subunit [Bryobacteraceae bacterium]|nr:efflux RND transporter periplasmic adaptor subunit [Bryobacteraceae bacterium]